MKIDIKNIQDYTSKLGFAMITGGFLGLAFDDKIEFSTAITAIVFGVICLVIGSLSKEDSE